LEYRKTNNNVTTAGNKTVLGLLVESNTLEANNNNKKLHYLKVERIDLVGKSQLIQTEVAFLRQLALAFIERDQLGQSNKYNYNYWSSPVSPINTTQNNRDYSVGGDERRNYDDSTKYQLDWRLMEHQLLISS
jgi:hypothetical protein